ncbi:hypothetical protein D3C75_1145120 [compost metagenome]
MLAFKNNRRGFNDLVFHRHRRGLHHRATEVAVQHFGAAVVREWLIEGGDHAVIQRRRRPFTPVEHAIVQPWLLEITLKAETGDCIDVFMQQAAFQQFAHQNRYAARCLEVVNIRRAVRVQAGHQRDDF